MELGEKLRNLSLQLMFWQIKNTCKLWTLFEKKILFKHML